MTLIIENVSSDRDRCIFESTIDIRGLLIKEFGSVNDLEGKVDGVYEMTSTG